MKNKLKLIVILVAIASTKAGFAQFQLPSQIEDPASSNGPGPVPSNVGFSNNDMRAVSYIPGGLMKVMVCDGNRPSIQWDNGVDKGNKTLVNAYALHPDVCIIGKDAEWVVV